MSETVAQIESVEGKDIAIKRGSRAGETATIYNVKTSEKTFSTFDRDLAEKAAQLRGQSAVLGYSVRENVRDGKTYTNYDLKSVEANNFAPQQPSQAPYLYPTSENTVSSQHFAAQPAETSSTASYVPANKDLQIARAVALKAAVEVYATGTLEDGILATADRYTDWLLNGTPSTQSGESDLDLGGSGSWPSGSAEETPLPVDLGLVKF